MISFKITAEDFNGDPQTETLWFHLSRKDLIDIEASEKGGLYKYLQGLMSSSKSGDTDTAVLGREMFDFFAMIAEKSYGVRSADGRRFVKNSQVLEDWKSSPFYDEFVMQILDSPETAAKFVNGVMPKQLIERARKEDPKLFSDIDKIADGDA